MTDGTHQVVVVGGGIAGLSAALSLAEAGLRPLVLEAAEQPGGRYASTRIVRFSYQGRECSFPLDHGVHGWWSQYRNLRRLLLRHGLLPRLLRAQRQAWVYGQNGRIRRAEVGHRLISSPLPAPFHYLWLLASPSFVRMMGPSDWVMTPWVGITLIAMLALDPMRDGDALAGRSALQLLWSWPPMLRAFGWALARSGLATGAENAPLAGFIALFRFYSLLRRDAIVFDYLPGDSGGLVVEPMALRITELGGEVRRGAAVAGVTKTAAGSWLVRTGQESVTALHVVLALDAPGAHRLLTAEPDTQAEAASMDWPEGQASAVVRFWFATTPDIDADGGMFGGDDFVLDNFFWVHQIQDAFALWHKDTGGSALECHIYGPPELLAQDDDALLARALSDVQRVWPSVSDQVVHSDLQRNPPVHTLFDVGTTQRHLGIETPWPGLYTAGDWVRYSAPALFLERAAVAGLAAANAVRRSLGIAELPLESYSGPEPLAAVIEGVFRILRRGMDVMARVLGK